MGSLLLRVESGNPRSGQRLRRASEHKLLSAAVKKIRGFGLEAEGQAQSNAAVVAVAGLAVAAGRNLGLPVPLSVTSLAGAAAVAQSGTTWSD